MFIECLLHAEHVASTFHILMSYKPHKTLKTALPLWFFIRSRNHFLENLNKCAFCYKASRLSNLKSDPDSTGAQYHVHITVSLFTL